MEEVPGAKRARLTFDDEEAFAGHDEKALLVALTVVQAEGTPRLEHADVEPQLPERPLALEVARHFQG